MADLTEQLSSQAVKLTGANSSGLETNYVNSDANGNLQTILKNGSGVETGTASVPLRTDPTGTTTQPVSQPTASNLNAQVVGNAAAGATDSGNPVKVGGVFNTALPTITNGQRGNLQLDSSSRQIIAPLTNTSVVKAQLQDNAGTAIVLSNNQLPSADVLNTTAVQASLAVSTTATILRAGGSNLANRKLLMFTPNAAGYSYGFTVGSQPFPVSNGVTITLSLGPNITVWIRKATGSSTVSVAELS